MPRRSLHHAGGPSLHELIDRIGAERILPVHTEHPEWFEERWGKRVVTVTEGVPIQLGS